MKKCIECGKQISDGSSTCPYCGAKVNETIYCPKCNSNNVNIGADPDGAPWWESLWGPFGKIARSRSRDSDTSTALEYSCNNCGFKFRKRGNRYVEAKKMTFWKRFLISLVSAFILVLIVNMIRMFIEGA